MNHRGLVHWNMHYPNHQIIENDIKRKSLFIVKQKGHLVGMFVLNKEQVDEYSSIEWGNDHNNPLIVHRMVIHPKWKNMAVEAKMLEFIENYTSEHGFDAVRLDVFGKSTDELDFLKSNEFEEKGEFLMEFQKFPFKCFEKTVKK